MLRQKIHGFSPDVERTMLLYKWPGNVRELANVVEYAANMADADFIQLSDLPDRIHVASPGNEVELRRLDEVERELIFAGLRVFGDTDEGKRKTARALGIGRATIYRKLREYRNEK